MLALMLEGLYCEWHIAPVPISSWIFLSKMLSLRIAPGPISSNSLTFAILNGDTHMLNRFAHRNEGGIPKCFTGS